MMRLLYAVKRETVFVHAFAFAFIRYASRGTRSSPRNGSSARPAPHILRRSTLLLPLSPTTSTTSKILTVSRVASANYYLVFQKPYPGV